MSVTIRRPNGRSLTFDASPSQKHDPQYEFTEHPIEDGSTISDHGRAMPRVLDVVGIVSEAPFGAIGGARRVREAIKFLDDAAKKSERLIVTTRRGTSSNWVILSYPHDETQVRGLVFEITLRQIRVATVSVINIPREVPAPRYTAVAPAEEDVGTQPTEVATPAQVEDVDQSWAISLGGAIGDAVGGLF